MIPYVVTLILNWEATPRRKKKQKEARRKKKKEDENTLGATGRRSVMTMLLHKSDIVISSYDLICILTSRLEKISLSLIIIIFFVITIIMMMIIVRCDGQPQCGDSTDEINCSVLQLDPSYNKSPSSISLSSSSLSSSLSSSSSLS